MMSHQMQLDLQLPMIIPRAVIRDQLVNRRSSLMKMLNLSLPDCYSKGQKLPISTKGPRVAMKGDHKSVKGNMASLTRESTGIWMSNNA